MWENEKREIIDISLKLVENGLVSGMSGNVSVRLSDPQHGDYIAITPSSRYYDSLTIEDIAVVNTGGNQIAGNLKPSIEMNLHLEIYKVLKSVNAVIHTHSIYATALAVAGLNIPPVTDEQVLYLGGEISIASHALPGTKQMAENVLSALGNKNAVLMANHGALVTGNGIRAAFENCILLERIAKVYIYALQICGVTGSAKQIKQVSPDALQEELRLYNLYRNNVEKE